MTEKAETQSETESEVFCGLLQRCVCVICVSYQSRLMEFLFVDAALEADKVP